MFYQKGVFGIVTPLPNLGHGPVYDLKDCQLQQFKRSGPSLPQIQHVRNFEKNDSFLPRQYLRAEWGNSRHGSDNKLVCIFFLNAVLLYTKLFYLVFYMHVYKKG